MKFLFTNLLKCAPFLRELVRRGSRDRSCPQPWGARRRGRPGRCQRQRRWSPPGADFPLTHASAARDELCRIFSCNTTFWIRLCGYFLIHLIFLSNFPFNLLHQGFVRGIDWLGRLRGRFNYLALDAEPTQVSVPGRAYLNHICIGFSSRFKKNKIPSTRHGHGPFS